MFTDDFLYVLGGFLIASFVGSFGFYQILSEIPDIRREHSIGSILTCLAWIAVMVAVILFAFRFGSKVGGFTIVGLLSGFMTSYKMVK